MNSLLCDYKDMLKDKFGYDEDLAQDIAIMAESLSDYYGEEYKSIILEAIANCKIVIAGVKQNSVIRENVGDVLEKENISLEDIPDNLRKKDRGFISRPVISFDNNTFKLVDVERLIVLPNHFSSASPESIGILAKACIELVKSSIATYKIRGNVLTTKKGFMTIKENLESSNGKVTSTLASCTGISLSNGMNTYDQLCVVREMYDDSYDVHGDDYERVLAGVVLETRGIKDELRLCEIVHDESQIKEVFSQEYGRSFEDFLKKTDKLARSEEKRKQAIIDPVSLKIAIDELDNDFNDIVTAIPMLVPAREISSTKKI